MVFRNTELNICSNRSAYYMAQYTKRTIPWLRIKQFDAIVSAMQLGEWRIHWIFGINHSFFVTVNKILLFFNEK